MATTKKKGAQKPAEVREWLVPMTYEYRGKVIVKAASEEEARQAAKRGDFEVTGDNEEVINWEVVGAARLNE